MICKFQKKSHLWRGARRSNPRSVIMPIEVSQYCTLYLLCTFISINHIIIFYNIKTIILWIMMPIVFNMQNYQVHQTGTTPHVMLSKSLRPLTQWSFNWHTSHDDRASINILNILIVIHKYNVDSHIIVRS